MSYRQLFLLILTIWSAEIGTRMLFDMMIPPQMEYSTWYLDKDKDGLYKGKYVEDLGSRGWQLVSVVPSPDNRDQMIMFFQRQSIFRFGR